MAGGHSHPNEVGQTQQPLKRLPTKLLSGGIAGKHISDGTIDNLTVTGNLVLPGTSSNMSIGVTPPTSATAGTGIWIDKTGFYSLLVNAYQVKIDTTTGALYAGGGNTILDVNGPSVVVTTDYADTRSYRLINSAGTVIGKYMGFDSGTTMQYVALTVPSRSAYNSYLQLTSAAPATYIAQSGLYATSGTNPAYVASITVTADSNAATPTLVQIEGTLNIGANTIGTAAFTASTAYDVAGAAAAVTPTTLGLVIGTNTQAYNANLTAINQALTTTSNPTFGTVTANLTGNASGSAATVTAAAQTAITSVGTLTSLGVGAVTSTGLLDVTVASGYAATLMGGGVGVGTANPSTLLHMLSAANTTLRVSNNTGGLVNSDVYLSEMNTGEAQLRQYGAYPMSFWTNNAQQITILSSGNFGVGTATPTGRLDVLGIASAYPSATVTAGDLVVDTVNRTVYVGKQSNTSGDNTVFTFRNRLGDVWFKIDPSTGFSYFDIGNVGIGTVVPPQAVSIGNQGALAFMELTANGAQYVAFKAPAAITTSITFTLPGVDGGDTQYLKTNGAGVLSWGTPAGAGGVTDHGALTGLADDDHTQYAPKASPTFTGTVTVPTPFTIGAVSMTATASKLNLLDAATGTTGTTNTNLVFSASPTFTGTVTLPASILIADNGILDCGSAEIKFHTEGIIEITGNVGVGGTPTQLLEAVGVVKCSGASGSFTFADRTISPEETWAWYANNHEAIFNYSVLGNILRVNATGSVLIGDSANAKMTLGLTINQGAADNEILAFKSSDVGHALTGITEADTFCEFHKASVTTGGVVMSGYKATGASSNAMALVGYLTDAADTNKLTTASGVISLFSRLNSAGSYTDIGTDGNLVVMKNNNTTQFIFDAEGSAHANVEWTTFDKHNDVALLGSLEAAMQDGVGNGFGKFLTDHKRDLERLNIAHFDDKPGHAMVNFTRLSMLLVGAIRQQAARIDYMEQRLLAGGAA